MTTLENSLDTPATPRLRADAERNRQRILEVAARVFAERGLDATLNDIAHEAGVGVGTVYRKFPDKAALIEELTTARLQGVLDRVAAASAKESGAVALRDLMWGAAEMRAHDRGLFQILFAAGTASKVRDERITRLLHAWDAVIARAVAEGAVRPGFSSVDVDVFMVMVGAVADATHDVAPLAWQRYAQVLMEGFAPQDDRRDLPPLALDDTQRTAIFLTG